MKLYLWTLSYFRPYIFKAALYVACGGALIWAEMSIPRRMGYLIDHAADLNQSSQQLWQLAIILMLIVIILIAKSIYNRLETILAALISRDQQRDLIQKLQVLGYPYFENHPTGEILALFENAVKETQKTYSFLLPQLVYAMAQFIVPSMILILERPMLFVAGMVGNILYVALNAYTNGQIEKYLLIETQAAQHSQQSMYDTLALVTELKARGSSEWQIHRAMADFDLFKIPRMKSILWRHIRFTTVGFTLTLSLLLFYQFGLNMFQSGTLTLGELIGYSFLMGLISRGFSVFFYIIPAQKHALHYAAYLYNFLHETPAVKEDSSMLLPTSSSYSIRFDQVSFSYNKEQTLLDNLTFIIEAGKKTAFVGPSGCGKSTILKLIGRHYEATSGNIYINDVPIKSLKTEDLRELIGLVPQEPYLFNTSIKENIRFAHPKASDQDIQMAAAKSQSHRFISEFEAGYESSVGERGSKLSGGQRQRIAIARMLLKNPEIVLLDEASSALDQLTEDLVKASIHEHLSHKTIVSVSHRMAAIRDFDRIFYMENGRILESGTYDDLMALGDKFYQMVMGGTADVG